MQLFRQKNWMLWFAVLFALLQTIAPLMHAHWQTPSHLLAPISLASSHTHQNEMAGMHLHVDAAMPTNVHHTAHQQASIGNSHDAEDILELDKSMVRDQPLLLSAVLLFVLFFVLDVPSVQIRTSVTRVSNNSVSNYLTRSTPPRAPPSL